MSAAVAHRLAHRRTHAPARTEHPDPDHRAQGTAARLQRGPGTANSLASCGPTTASVRGASAKHAVDDARDVVGGRPPRRARSSSSSVGISPSTSSARPRRRMRLADVSSDIASEPARWPFAASSSASESPSPTSRSSSVVDHVERLVHALGRGARVDREEAGVVERARGTSTPSTRGRAPRGPPGTAATTCRRRAPGSRR